VAEARSASGPAFSQAKPWGVVAVTGVVRPSGAARWLAGMALAASFGCDVRDRAAPRPEAAAKVDAPAAADASASAASLPSAPAAAAGLMGALGRVGEPGYYDERRESPGARADAPHHVVLELAGGVTELDKLSLFGGGQGTKLRSITGRLHALATNANVQDLLLRFGDLGVSMAQAEELRAAIAAVRKSGKPVHCFADAVDNADYFVMTACESITLTPTGEVVITGPALQPLYLKGLLDKLGVEADFLHVGAFKGAAEPLTRTAPSPG